MKGCFVLLTLFLFSFTFKHEKENVIPWNENRPLTWDDFRGEPQKRFAAASTTYDILKHVSGSSKTGTFKIEAVFYPDKSWKKTEWIDETILRHEQKHFDIAELFARRLRKQLKEQRFTSQKDLAQRAKELFKKADEEMDVYQDEYDDKTDGSMNGEKQGEWNRKIARELEELSGFSAASFTVAIRN